jgi:HSP20 family protein
MEPLWNLAGPVGAFAPAFEVKETDNAYVFKADLPGVNEKDLEVTLTGDRLTISGKRETEEQKKGETYYVYERNYGAFTRTFTLPDGVDAMHIAADAKDGVLTVMLPKAPEAQPKKIAVATGAAAGRPTAKA